MRAACMRVHAWRLMRLEALGSYLSPHPISRGQYSLRAPQKQLRPFSQTLLEISSCEKGLLECPSTSEEVTGARPLALKRPRQSSLHPFKLAGMALGWRASKMGGMAGHHVHEPVATCMPRTSCASMRALHATCRALDPRRQPHPGNCEGDFFVDHTCIGELLPSIPAVHVPRGCSLHAGPLRGCPRPSHAPGLLSAPYWHPAHAPPLPPNPPRSHSHADCDTCSQRPAGAPLMTPRS